MNTKGIKFLAVLAVLAMAFAAFAFIAPADENEATAADIIDFDGNVVFADYKTTLNPTGTIVNAIDAEHKGLGNVISVSEDFSGDFAVYTVTGYFAYHAAGGDTEVWGKLGMAAGNLLAFNMTKTADSKIFVAGSGSTKDTPVWAKVDALASGTTEPNLYNVASTGVIWIGYGAADSATPTAYAKIICGTDLTDSFFMDDGTGKEVLVAGTAAKESTKNVAVIDDIKITATSTSNADYTKATPVLYLKGTNPVLYIAPLAKLTVEVTNESLATGTSVVAMKMNTGAKIIGGTGAELEIVDKVTLASEYATPTGLKLSSIGLLVTGTLTTDNVSISIKGATNFPNVYSCGVYAQTSISSDSTWMEVKSGNRGLYSGTITLKEDSIVNATAGEYAIRSSVLTIGSGTDGNDETRVSASLNANNPNQTPDEFYGIKSAGAVQIKAGSVVTADAIEVVGGSLTVDGVLNVKNSSYAGYSVTTSGVTTVYQPAGLLVVDSIDNDKKITAMAGTNKVTIGAKGSVNVESGAAIMAYISDGVSGANESKVQFGAAGTSTAYVPSYITAGSDLVLAHGSVYINGVLTEAVDGKITVTGKAEIIGTLDCELVIDKGATVTVPSGEALIVTAGNQIKMQSDNTEAATLNIVGDITAPAGSVVVDTAVSGTAKPVIETSNPDVIKNIAGTGVEVEEPEATAWDAQPVAADTDEYYTTVQEYLNNNIAVKLTKNIIIFENRSLTFPSSLILDLNGNTITINDKETGTDGELVVDGAKIVNSGATGKIDVDGMLSIKAADVCVDVDVDQNTGYVGVVNPKNMTVKGELTSNVAVGYGNTLTVEDATVPAGKKIEAFGKIIMTGTDVVKKGANILINTYATAQIDGTLTVEGNMTSIAFLTVNGTLTVSNDTGGATVTASFFNNGTINVVKPRSSEAIEDNTLVAYGWNYGTMKITGVLSGYVYDCGEISFNGTSDNATVYLTDGVEFTVTSVIGTMWVEDAVNSTIFPDAYESDLVTIKDKVVLNAGNIVRLSNVKGVVLSQEIKSTVKEGTWSGEVTNIMHYTANITVSGTYTSVDEDGPYSLVSTSGASANEWTSQGGKGTANSNVSKGAVSVDDSAVGKNVQLFLAVGSKVTGIVTVTAKTSLITVVPAGKVAVTGMIVIGPDAASQAILTGTKSVYYVVQDADANDTYYYTTLAKAMEAVGTAYENKFTVVGENTISSGNITIPANVSVGLAENSKLTISTKATIEVEEGAELNSVNGELKVTGTLIIDDKNTGLKFTTGKFTYEVYKENGDVITYTGVLGAISTAEAGDTITINQDAEVKESFTIPKDVTLVVPNKETLTIKADKENIKVTINGTLVLQRGSAIEKAGLYEVTLVINGVLAVDESADYGDLVYFTIDNYVTFDGKIDGRTTHFASNLTYAAENCDNGEINVYGQVSAGDITLKTGEKATETVVLVIEEGTIDEPTSVSVSSITLDGAAISVANNQYATFSGEVIAAAQGATASVMFSSAYSFGIGSGEETEATGKVDYLYITHKGFLASGKIAICEGIVTVNDGFRFFADPSNRFSIASGATLEVPENEVLMLRANGMTYATDISGKLVIGEDAIVDISNALVTGEIYVEKTTDVSLYNTVQILGSLNVVSTDDEPALVKIGDVLEAATLIVGSVPGSLGATASISGPIELNNDSFIALYDGDLTEAQINWHKATQTSQVKQTAFMINDVLYMIAIGSENTNVDLVNDNGPTAVISGTFKLAGLDMSEVAVDSDGTTKWKDADGNYIVNTKVIGDYELISYKAPAAVVEGVITVSPGIALYIDGKYAAMGTTVAINADSELTVGEHVVKIEASSTSYDVSKVTVLFNGKAISGNKFVITADMEEFTLVASGATPVEPTPSPEPQPQPIIIEEDDSFGLTQILLIALVIMIGALVVVLILRFNRS